MTDTKFTPGPWTFDTSKEWPSYIKASSDDVLFGCGCCGSPNLSRDDAHLIAAAPDLYEALEFVSNVLGEITEYPHVLSELEMNDAMRVDHALHEARAALAKARGDHSSSG